MIIMKNITCNGVAVPSQAGRSTSSRGGTPIQSGFQPPVMMMMMMMMMIRIFFPWLNSYTKWLPASCYDDDDDGDDGDDDQDYHDDDIDDDDQAPSQHLEHRYTWNAALEDAAFVVS